MQEIVQKLRLLRPGLVRSTLKSIYLLFACNKYYRRARDEYLFTDEHIKFVHILEAINYVNTADVAPVYFEFGCHSGRTFAAAVRAAHYLGMHDASFFAFDSFQGLPTTNPENDGIFQAGDFYTTKSEFIKAVKKMSGLQIKQECIIEGFFANSLSQELQKQLPQVGVVHIDVDLYSSTVEVLNFIKPLLVIGTVLLFDDWYCFAPGSNKGEQRALKEFCLNNPSFKIEAWKSYSTYGKSFFVTALP